MLCGMATIEYLHLCDYAFAGENGKQCIIGIFDAIRAPTFPTVHPMMAIALRLRGNAHEVLPLKFELGRPNGEVLATMQGDVTMGPDGSAFMQMQIGGAQFPEPGRYTVKVSSSGQILTTHSLNLQKAQPPTPSAPPPKQMH